MTSATLSQAASALGLSQGAVRGLLATGYLKGEKRDRVWQISLDSLRVLQALLRAPTRTVHGLPAEDEQRRIPRSHCPVCVGLIERAEDRATGWEHEFLECKECNFSIHESLLENGASEAVRERIRDHLEKLETTARQGELARACLKRRARSLNP